MPDNINRLLGELVQQGKDHAADIVEIKTDVKGLVASHHESMGALRQRSATWGFVGGLVGAFGSWFSAHYKG